jgi:glutamine synthetase
MRDFELAAHRLGIPVRTRHNEVAPNQFECAPVYEEANLAVDHNQLLMDLLPKVARRHHFAVLLHEKPFSLVNGSGKHNNWSMQTDQGENLLSPGADKKSNLRFLSFLVVSLKALLDHNALIRAAIASPSNDLRLGANEAPPAIISAFIGAQLTQTLDQLTGNGDPGSKERNNGQKAIEVPKIPEILMDNTDRNRTSPFAFTGNKFELRAVGSSANCAAPMIALNAAVAQSIRHFLAAVAERRKKGKSKDAAIMDTIRQFALESRPILFEGNCYAEEWKREAEARGLENIPSSADAFKAFLRDTTLSLFAEGNILSERELKARYEIRLENYIKKTQIESRVMGDLATNHIIPTAIRYQNLLVENVKGLKEVLDQKSFTKLSKVQLQNIRDISLHINEIRLNVAAMIKARKEANHLSDIESMTQAYDKVVRTYFEPLRYHVDKLEMLVDDELWPLPKYRELLFVR